VTYFCKNVKSTFEHNSTQEIWSEDAIQYGLNPNMVTTKNQEIYC
jgi:hypothetical protein